ncbi:MAG: DUF3667 domain-containing protein [Bacteroidales bacterium]|nr:DUF3667 domain-containing protein [Bacteroidales bacterium]
MKKQSDSLPLSWLRPRLRLYAIYRELGYVPWRKPSVKRQHKTDGVYMGGREMIPFLNDDAKRTITQLVFRPGYMMRDYILRGDHERYLAPLTALLVFFSVFSLLLSVFHPDTQKRLFEKEMLEESDKTEITIDLEDGSKVIKPIDWIKNVYLLTCLDQYPEMADTPWKRSLAALESDLRSKGIYLFLADFLVMWLLLWIALRKFKVSFSGAAALSAYVQCQLCLFQLLALLVTLGKSPDIGILLSGLLIALDLHQFLGVGFKKGVRLTLKVGMLYVAVLTICVLAIFVLTLLLAKSVE